MNKETLIKALHKQDSNRPRSLQKEIGVSALGGCRTNVWLQLQGTKPTNEPLRLAAIMGTAIHAAIESAFAGSSALIEERVEIDGLPPATIDYFDPKLGEVVDWKTITKKNADYFVSKQKRWQVQTYGYLLTRAGHKVKTVTLVGIPRDGNENDIVVYSEPYDESVALEALAWLDEVKALDVAPAPEREATFCKDYCQFFGACAGRGKDLSGDLIVDDSAAQAASDYVAIGKQIKELENRRDGAKAVLEGFAGVTIDGVKVSWSEINGRGTPDLEKIQYLLGDVPVPMKFGQPSIRLMVK